VQQPESKRTLSYVPDDGAALRYSLAMPFLMVAWDRRAWLLFLGLLAAAGWWALVGIQRQPVDWWLGFVVVALGVLGMYVGLAVAVRRRLASGWLFPANRVAVAVLTPEFITFELADRVQQIRRFDIDRMGSVFGFVLLGVKAQGTFWIVPRQLVPPELFADYRARSVGATA
jgi:hypothetical protein